MMLYFSLQPCPARILPFTEVQIYPSVIRFVFIGKWLKEGALKRPVHVVSLLYTSPTDGTRRGQMKAHFGGALCMTAVLASSLLAASVCAQSSETMYLSDTVGDTDGKTGLYRVTIDAVTGRANLEPLLTNYPALGQGMIPLNHADTIAATPDGARLWLIDCGKLTAVPQLAYYDLATNVLTIVGAITGITAPAGVDLFDQAAAAPDGTVYVTSVYQDRLYRLNTATAAVTTVGLVVTPANRVVDIAGGDLVFGADNKLYLWVNGARTGAPKGLYWLALPSLPTGNAVATYMGTSTDFISGLAIRDNGFGNPVGSSIYTDEVVAFNKNTGAVVARHPMYKGAVRFNHTYGDMTAGPLVQYMYLCDTLGSADGKSALFRVSLNTVTGRAQLDPVQTNCAGLAQGEIPLNHADVMAATPDGSRLWLIEAGPYSAAPLLAYHDLGVAGITLVGAITGLPAVAAGVDNLDQGAVAPDGQLYITAVLSDELYVVSTSTAVATLIGPVRMASGQLVDIKGSDIAFDSYGQLYLWVNYARGAALVGLYRLDLPAVVPGTVIANYLGGTYISFLSGMALQANGGGNPVLSSIYTDEIFMINKTNGTLIARYPMYRGNVRFNHIYGDMTIGPIRIP
jgi:hypothetical protein